MQEPATAAAPQRRAAAGDPRRARARRQGGRRAPRRRARRLGGHDPPRPARARRPGPRPARPRRRARARAAAGLLRHRRETCDGREGRARRRPPSRCSPARGSSCSTARRPTSSSRAGCPPDHACTVLTNSPPIAAALADHPDRRGRDDRRAARQARAGDGRRGGRRLHPHACAPTPACSASARCTRRPASPPTTSTRRRSSARWCSASADVIALATSDKLQRRQRRTWSRRSSELTHVVAEAAAPDELLDPYRALGVTRDARMSPRWATTGVFVVNGAAIGTWVAQIPWIQERFDLSKSAMGLVLLGMSLAVDPRLPDRGPGGRPARLGADGLDRRRRLRARRQPARARAAPAARRRRAGRARRVERDDGRGDEQPRREASSSDLGGRSCRRCTPAGRSAAWPAAGFAAACAALGLDPRIAVAIASALMLALVSRARARIGHGSAAEGDERRALHAALARRRAARRPVPAA